MNHAWTIDWERPATDRRQLAELVRARLESLELVASTALFGSLASSEPDGFPADSLSDIDIRVALGDGTDRAFFDTLPTVLSDIGRTALYNMFVSPDGYIASFMFDTYSPFWHVDVVISAPHHEPGEDLLIAAHYERAFGSWISATKRFVRANEFLGYFLELMPEVEPSTRYQPRLLFEQLLTQWHRLSRDSMRRDIGRQVLDGVLPASAQDVM